MVPFYAARKDATPYNKYPINILIQPILFLFKDLTVAKQNYWVKKLEIIRFV